MKTTTSLSATLCIILLNTFLQCSTLTAQGLGAASGFALFTATGAFANTGAGTVVTGDVGTNAGAFAAFPPGTLIGSQHVVDPISAQAATDVNSAFMNLGGLTCGQVLGTTLGNGQILTPDIYCLGAASVLNGNLTLDGQGNPNAVFIIKIDGAFTSNANSSVTLTNAASICNVFWWINGSVSIGNNSTFRGTIVANGALSFSSGASLYGRGLSRAGAISLTTNTVTLDTACTVSGNCDPDQSVPLILSIPKDTSFEINSQTSCQPTLYWPTPQIFDDCRQIVTGFTDFMSYGNWVKNTTGSGTPVYSDFTPDSIRIRGASGGVIGTSSTAEMCVRFDCSGNVDFDWLVRKTGFSLSFSGDEAYYVLNGVTHILTPLSGLSAHGHIKLSVASGDELCFRVASNNFGAQTYLTISNIKFDNLQIAIISGPSPDSSPGAGDGTPIDTGVHTVVYQVMDCAGNSSTRSFTITTTDAPPTITCPEDVIVNLDTFDCNRVYCYNVRATDNCVNTNLNIPGYTYLGTHNGNTYYLSPPGAPNKTTWLNANLIAAQLGGHLVTIADSAENAFLASTIFSTFNPFDTTNNQYWIGLRYMPFFNQFRWTTCEDFNYANWGFGQPGIIPGDYVYFWDAAFGTWWDSPSLLNRRFIVEFEGGLQIQLLSGIPSGSPFPPGVTTNTYQVTDAYGQTATCSFSVNVIGSTSLVCKDINVSLNQNCEALVTPQMVLAGEYNCYDVFNVALSHYGIPVPNPIDSHYLGQHIIATISDPTTGNSCWSNVTIEDKLAPVAICRADTTDCYSFKFNFPLSYTGQDCSAYTVTTLDERIEHFNCDSVFLKAVYRDILITDQGGNTDQCTDTIFVKRIKAEDVVLPTLSFTNFSCTTKFLKDQNGHPSPLVTRVPYIVLSDGTKKDIWPLNQLLDCNLLISYEDIDLGEINCVWKIMRIWTVREWWCNTEITRQSNQVIIIKDVEGPEIIRAPNGFDATTGERDCIARVLLPSIEAEDACHNDIRIDIAYPGGILLNQNGGYVDLPVGEDTIFYRVYDGCYNLTNYYIIIHVADQTSPVAVCDRNTVVSLNHAGYNWVPAEVFDDGSFDECTLDHFEVRRMDRDFCGGVGEDDWGPEVGFCCEDIGNTIMVAFKAVDQSGNEAICMVNVDVQDKDRPLITCLPNITVDCRFDIDYNHLDVFGKIVVDQAIRDTIIIDPVYYHVIDGHPLDGYAQDNCPPTILESVDTSNINQCGIGTIIRQFQAIDQQGNVSDICYQYITIINHDTFDINDIVWPLDLDTLGICNPNELIAEHLSAPYDKPVTNDDECSLIGYSYSDVVYSATLPGDPCFKIIRTWKVIDWCQRDIDGNIIVWTHDQIIRVMNAVDPVITRVTQDTTICSYDINCRPIPVRFSIEATDDCTDPAQMLYTYKIDFDGDGTFDVIHSAIGGAVAEGTWPLGRHIVKWVVEDRCGNTATSQFVLDLQNCKSPVAYCLNGLSTNLTPMDTTGDGIPDIAIDTVWAKDFDAGSYHTCGYPVSISFSADLNDTYVVYNCDSIGSRAVEMWVTDINGNTSFCRTFIDVQDNTGFCPSNIKSSNVEGIVATEKNEKVENVTISLRNSGMNDVKTNADGKYSFQQIPNGQAVTVKPSKTDGWLNGVTTADIVKIQRHILGIEPLSSAYKMIAADVNKSRTITAKDVSDLRRLILGVTTEIPGNTSWRFIHQLYSFNDVKTALDQNFPESYDINSLNNNMNLDFYAVKTGDVNGTAATRGYNTNTNRNRYMLELQVDEQELSKDQTQDIEVRVANGSAFEGMQFTLQWDVNQLQLEGAFGNEEIKIREDNYSMVRSNDGKLTFSWNGEMNNYDWILKLKFKAKQTIKVSEAITVNSSITPAVSVVKDNIEEGQVVLNFNGSSSNAFIVLQNEPNPWSHETTIGMILPAAGEVNLTLYDVAGKVYLREKAQMNKGYNEYILGDASLIHSGVYYYQVDYLTNTITRKMVIAK